jgi:subtilisin family serine protease
MKLPGSMLFVCLFILISGCANIVDVHHLGDSKTDDDRRLLVTFVDQTINRKLSANTQEGYFNRGQYSNSGWSERMAHDLADRYHLQFVIQWPVTTLGVNCVVYDVPRELQLQQVITELQKDPQVSLVQQMHNFEVLGSDQFSSIPAGDPYLQLQASFKSLEIANLHRLSTGRGVRIAVIDTGVDIDHPDLKGQIKLSENMAPEPSDHNLADIHGTAVAGILSAHSDNGIGIAGIAPEAEIFAFRACWPDKPSSLAAHCNSFTLALALNQAISLNCRIVNLSLSGPDDPLLTQLLEIAFAKGILVVAAVPGKNQAGGFPANVPGVIAVGFENGTNNSGIIAPGQDILTTVPHQAYDFMTGSSFATPHVTGVAALLLQLHPDWQAPDIKRVLNKDSNLLTAKSIEMAMATAK